MATAEEAIAGIPKIEKAGRFVGITTYIKTRLMQCKSLDRRVGGGGKNAAEAGLRTGRATDTAFTRHVSGEALYSASNPKHSRLGHVLRALRAARIKLVRAQVTVVSEKLRIKTTIDALGVRDGRIVVVELKATRLDKHLHRKVYNAPSHSAPMLTNNMSCCEENLHKLQAGFGVCALRHARVTGRAQAVVVLSYEDVARVVEVPPVFASSVHFQLACAVGPRKKALPGGRKTYEFSSWPASDPRVTKLVERENAAPGVAPLERGAVLACSKEQGTPLFVAGFVAEKWSSISKNRRAALLRLLGKMHADAIGSGGARAQTYVLAPHGKHLRLTRVKTGFYKR